MGSSARYSLVGPEPARAVETGLAGGLARPDDRLGALGVVFWGGWLAVPFFLVPR